MIVNQQNQCFRLSLSNKVIQKADVQYSLCNLFYLVLYFFIDDFWYHELSPQKSPNITSKTTKYYLENHESLKQKI